jgi:hypothetical protein
MRRLLCLIVPLLLAAIQTPPAINARLGDALMLQLPLPPGVGATVAGFPDLTPFALRDAPKIINDTLILDLVPLRPGRYTFPALPLHSDSGPLTTAALRIDVTAPDPPMAAHPLKELPTTPEASRPRNEWLHGLALTTAVLLALFIWRRYRCQPLPATPAPLDQLAARFADLADGNDPRWAEFRSRLERQRFAPLATDPAIVAELTAQFDTLRQEGL